MGDKKNESNRPDRRRSRGRRRLFGFIPLARYRALVLVCDRLEREGIRALLGGWGYESVGAASFEQVTQALPALPDLLVVGGSRHTEECGAACIADLRALYAVQVPAIVIGEPNRSAGNARNRDYMLLRPLFTPSQLRTALVVLLEDAARGV